MMSFILQDSLLLRSEIVIFGYPNHSCFHNNVLSTILRVILFDIWLHPVFQALGHS